MAIHFVELEFSVPVTVMCVSRFFAFFQQWYCQKKKKAVSTVPKKQNKLFLVKKKLL